MTIEILKTRLAAGEISMAEYREIVAELGNNSNDTSTTSAGAPAYDKGKLIAELDNIALFDRGLSIAGEFIPLS